MERGTRFVTIAGNEAAAAVAHRPSEVIAIYPITPSSAMGELADAWSAAGRVNLLGRGALMELTQHDVDARWHLYEQLGEMERDDN